MKSDSIGSFLALLFAVAFLVAGIWFNVLSPSENRSSLPDCDYGFSTNCEP